MTKRTCAGWCNNCHTRPFEDGHLFHCDQMFQKGERVVIRRSRGFIQGGEYRVLCEVIGYEVIAEYDTNLRQTNQILKLHVWDGNSEVWLHPGRAEEFNPYII